MTYIFVRIVAHRFRDSRTRPRLSHYDRQHVKPHDTNERTCRILEPVCYGRVTRPLAVVTDDFADKLTALTLKRNVLHIWYYYSTRRARTFRHSIIPNTVDPADRGPAETCYVLAGPLYRKKWVFFSKGS